MKKKWLIVVAVSIVAAVGVFFATPRGQWYANHVREKWRNSDPDRVVDFEAARTRLLARLGASELPDPATTRIVISKSERRASILAGDAVLVEYPVVLGRHPEGAKEREGDGRTPEGDYHLCTRLDKSAYHLFLGLNYPAPADAEPAARAERIDASTANAIIAAHANQQKPDWDTPMGGAVGLHGGGTEFDWTLGCIAFENEAIEEIWLMTQHWTPVQILP